MKLDEKALEAAAKALPAGEYGDLIDLNRTLLAKAAITSYLSASGCVLVPRKYNAWGKSVWDEFINGANWVAGKEEYLSPEMLEAGIEDLVKEFDRQSKKL